MNALCDLDDAYANSPRCTWLMNKKTLATVSGIVTKYGLPFGLVKWIDGQPTIYGIPVKICPSMDNICNGKEAANTIEYGNVGLIGFMRAGGDLLWNDAGSPAPFIVIQTHNLNRTQAATITEEPPE